MPGPLLGLAMATMSTLDEASMSRCHSFRPSPADKYKPVRAVAVAGRTDGGGFGRSPISAFAPDSEASPEYCESTCWRSVFSEDIGLRPGTDGGAIVPRAECSGLSNAAPRGAGDTLVHDGRPDPARVSPTARTNSAVPPPEIAQIVSRSGRTEAPGPWRSPAGAFGGSPGPCSGDGGRRLLEA